MRDVVHGFANTLSVAPPTFPLRRDDVDYVVFCFGKPEDAEVFRQRFGGDCLTVAVRLAGSGRVLQKRKARQNRAGAFLIQPMMVTTGRTGTPHRRHQSSQTARRGSELA
jgi:hypothetical protein